MAAELSKVPLARHVEKAIKQVAIIHREHHAEARPSEQITDRTVSIIGTPTFLTLLEIVAVAWMIAAAGSNAIDPSPFPRLEMACSFLAILLAVLILAAQRRDDRLATRRE